MMKGPHKDFLRLKLSVSKVSLSFFSMIFCALASLRSIVSLIKQTQIAEITTESISQNEIVSISKYQCQMSNNK